MRKIFRSAAVLFNIMLLTFLLSTFAYAETDNNYIAFGKVYNQNIKFLDKLSFKTYCAITKIPFVWLDSAKCYTITDATGNLYVPAANNKAVENLKVEVSDLSNKYQKIAERVVYETRVATVTQTILQPQYITRYVNTNVAGLVPDTNLNRVQSTGLTPTLSQGEGVKAANNQYSPTFTSPAAPTLGVQYQYIPVSSGVSGLTGGKGITNSSTTPTSTILTLSDGSTIVIGSGSAFIPTDLVLDNATITSLVANDIVTTNILATGTSIFNGEVILNSSVRDSYGATGTANQILMNTGTSTRWASISTGALASGTATSSTLRWNGSNWVENTSLLVDALGNATMTNLTVGGTASFSTTTIATATIDQLNLNNMVANNATITSSTSTNSYADTASSTNLFATLARLANAYIAVLYGGISNFTTSNASTTNSSTTNATIGNITTLNTTGGNINTLRTVTGNVTNLAARNINSTGTANFALINASTTNASTSNSGNSNVANLLTANNIIATGTSNLSTIVSDATSTFATTTTASGTVTYLNSNSAYIVSLVSGTSTISTATITSLDVVNATITNSTTTYSYVTSLFSDNSTSTNLYSNFASITEATTTNLFAELMSAITAFIANLTATNATITNATATYLYASNAEIQGGNATMTSATTSKLYAVNATFDNASSTALSANTFYLNGFSSGSLLFATSSGLIAEDNSSLFWDTLYKRLSLGAGTSPSGVLTIQNSVTDNEIVFNGNSATQIASLGTAPLSITSNSNNLILGTAGVGSQSLIIDSTGNVGIGSSTPSSQLSIAQGSLTSAETGISLSSTWNNAAVAFRGITGDITDTASLDASYFIDLKRNGAPVFQVSKTGSTTIQGSLSVLGTTTINNGLDMSGFKIINVAAPTGQNDVTNKAYVDAFVQGISYQAPVINFSTTTIVASTTGNRYIISTGSSGTGCNLNQIATNNGIGSWSCYTPATGTTAYVDNGLDQSFNYNGIAWVSLGATINHQALIGLQGGQSGEYYHLTNTQHTDLNSINAQLSQLQTTGVPTFAGINITGGLNAGFGDGTAASSSIYFVNDTDTGFYRPGTNQLGIATGGYQRAVFDASGRLGLGNSAPAYKLDLAGTSTISDRAIAINGVQALYLPDQSASAFTGSIFLGNGGTSLSHTAGAEGYYNTGVGIDALLLNSTGSSNTASGYQTLRANTSGYQNSAFGSRALLANTSGIENTAIGGFSMQNNTTGSQNTASGKDALYSNTIGINNSAFGRGSMYTNLDGSYNTAAGRDSLYSNTSGTSNSAFGYNSLYVNLTGSQNSAFGGNSLFRNSTGNANTALGRHALYNSKTGSNNTAAGFSALYYNTSATSTTAFGSSAGSGVSDYSNQGGTYIGYQSGFSAATSSDYNSFVGYQSGYGMATGLNNVALGANALKNATSTSNQVAIGFEALKGNTIDSSGSGNVAIGYLALASNRSGSNNTSIGTQSLNFNSSGSQNIAIGTLALGLNLTGLGNSAVGYAALYNNSSGSGNSAFGQNALYTNSTGQNNAALGVNSLRFNTTGTGNTGVGYQTLQANTTGGNNTGLGRQALFSNVTGSNNLALGYAALYYNISATTSSALGYEAGKGTGNYYNQGGTYIGYQSGFSAATSSDYNSFVGYQSGYGMATGLNNVALGANALKNATSTSNQVAIGFEALLGGASDSSGANNSAIGYQALRSNTSGSNNLANGYQSLRSNTTGARNSALGFGALFSNTLGNDNTAVGYQALLTNSSGGLNTAIGRESMYFNTIGSNNTSIGYRSLYNNSIGTSSVAIGHQALLSNTTGGNNTALGVGALSSNTTGSNNTAIGSNAQVAVATDSNQIRMGDANVILADIEVAWNITSDRTLKENINSIPLGLSFINTLNPVEYKRIGSKEDSREFGFIAQELEQALASSSYQGKGLVATNDTGIKSVRYNDLFSPIVKSIQELNQKVEDKLTSNQVSSIIALASTTNLISGNINYSSNVLDMSNNTIINVKAISSASGKWSIDENGRIVTRELCLEDNNERVCVDKDVLKIMSGAKIEMLNVINNISTTTPTTTDTVSTTTLVTTPEVSTTTSASTPNIPTTSDIISNSVPAIEQVMAETIPDMLILEDVTLGQE